MHGGHETTLPPELRGAGHVCAVVDDACAYGHLAAGFLGDGRQRGEKTVAFGPEAGAGQARLRPLASMIADPYTAILDRGPLRPAPMLAAFREQAALARREGFTGLRVAADMDWLLPAAPAADELLAFEVMLDRAVSQLDVSVLCVYRRGSFDRRTIRGMTCIHPVSVGHPMTPPFKLVAGDDGDWVLSGAIDFTVAPHLAAALTGTAATPWVLDLTDLDFIDVAGMRAIAEVARSTWTPLELRNVPSPVRRHWDLAGFGDVAPAVRFTS